MTVQARSFLSIVRIKSAEIGRCGLKFKRQGGFMGYVNGQKGLKMMYL
jgi:hypothetical protein